MQNKVTNETLLLKNVLYTPTFHENIISIGTFVRDSKYELGMKNNKMTLTKTGKAETLDFKRDHLLGCFVLFPRNSWNLPRWE